MVIKAFSHQDSWSVEILHDWYGHKFDVKGQVCKTTLWVSNMIIPVIEFKGKSEFSRNEINLTTKQLLKKKKYQ